ncbi:hypothetical protein [Paenibacillus koleovorans]|uniref:hypothetical protein n=1 Tax=Paenibacillus koleovorans TaxID=121608 RepID=UPI000FDB8F45|nr:hypothetical protein [Paenibacillus koleovorans]
MSKSDSLSLSQEQLIEAWQSALPGVLHDSDKFEVHPGEHKHSMQIHIASAGHSMYSFDFGVTYMDTREVRVDLIDVEKADKTVDERNETIQQLVEDYVRHIHECAQTLHSVTHM